MNQQQFEQWSEGLKKLQEPFQAIAELNVKTLQSLASIKPEDLAQIKKPEEFFEKQVHMAVENGHKALDYMQKYAEIVEKTLLNLVDASKKTSKK